MTTTTKTLAELIGSRICHDLISPIGAIGNGLELLSMSGAGAGPEMSLINDSLVNANARIRFYRIAFGAAGNDQSIARQEVTSILTDLTRGSRLKISWTSPNELLRRDAKLIFLLIQCCESAMPYGGDVTVTQADGGWSVKATAAKMKDLDGLWDHLGDAETATEITPAHVHFGLTGHAAADCGRKLNLTRRDGMILIDLSARVRA